MTRMLTIRYTGFRDCPNCEGRGDDGAAWRLTVEDADTVIPAVVQALVAVGCQVREVSPVRPGIREQMERNIKGDAS